MMNTDSRSQDLNQTRSTGISRGQRLLASLGFFAFEALFIWTLGDKVYDYSYFSPVLWGILAIAGAGFLALGYCSRSWLSALVLPAPLLIAIYFENVVWTTQLANGGSIGVNANFAEIWLALSVIFVPAWTLGVLITR
ncbi:MAG: hypothetical protein WBP55_10800 [Solirubrobacterales bacterium]